LATTLKRINVTFSPEIHAAILECSEASGIAASQVVAMLMGSTLPVLQAMTKAFRTARTDPTQAIQVMAQLADQAAVTGAQASLDLGTVRLKMPRRTTRR
jgi:hypothetical protein